MEEGTCDVEEEGGISLEQPLLESTPSIAAVSERRNGDATLPSESGEEEEEEEENAGSKAGGITPIAPSSAVKDSTGKKVTTLVKGGGVKGCVL